MSKITLPMIALREMTILPYMVIHFDVSRKKSIKSVEYALKNGQRIFLVTQKMLEIVRPGRRDVYNIGCICEVKQLVKMPGGNVRVMVKGLLRAELDDMYEEGDIKMACVIPDEVVPVSEEDKLKMHAGVELLKELMEKYYIATERNQGDNIARIKAITDFEELTYTAIAECSTDIIDRQTIFNDETAFERFEDACDLVNDEINAVKIKNELAQAVKERVDKSQKEYILREQIQAIKQELGEDEPEAEIQYLRKRTDSLNAPDYVKAKLKREIKKYDTMSSSSAEASVVRSYIDTILEMPWNKCTEDNYDIENASKILDEDHYGLEKVKERILEFLAVRALTGKGDSPIICLVGPPGTGKTSIAKSVATALNKKYIRICLGGVRDEAEIRGHRRTYIGAMPGRIATGLKQARSANPLMLLDEIDKVGKDSRGDTASALLEILDSAQNNAFRDHYIELPLDLSQVMFIATANDTSSIPGPLLDRMEIIELNSYTRIEKFHIAKNYLVKKQLHKNGLAARTLFFTDEAIMKIIESYTKEAGVRELERQISAVCRKAAKMIMTGKQKTHKITVRNIEKYLGNEKYMPDDMLTEPQTGIVKGLAWTLAGGTTLDVETVVMDGKGSLNLTGKLGDVMKESAGVAFGYVRYTADKYNIPADEFQKKDIYIHFPEGAVPKDGPSAGITIALSIISAFTGRKVRNDIAMTGEITLHGNVLPIGGLKEKLLAANILGIKTVLIPEKNKNDLKEIEPEVTQGMNIIPVSYMDQVIKEALL